MLRTFSLASLVLASSLFAGCATEEILEDGENDSFDLGGKADGGALTEGSPTALAVLKVASEASKAVLTGEVKISARTADNIITARAAGPFATLAKLDAVPWVGPVALDQLVAYVEAKGLVGGASPLAAVAARKGWSGSYWGMSEGALARGWVSGPRRQYSETEVRAFDACIGSYTASCKSKLAAMAGTEARVNMNSQHPLAKWGRDKRKEKAKAKTAAASRRRNRK